MNMTRFNISLDEGVEMVHWSIENSLGGEIFRPKIPSYRISDVAEAIAADCEKRIVGIRPGEKIHEELITSSDSNFTIDIGKFYAILAPDKKDLNRFKESFPSLKKVEKGFSYNSFNNPDYLSIDQIRGLIKKYVDPNFKPV